MYDFFQETPANVKGGDTPGYDSVVYIGLYEKFLTIGQTTASPSAEGDTMIIPAANDHTFTADDGFVQLTGFRDGAEVKWKGNGEEGFQSMESELELFVVGDHAAIKEKLSNYLNKSVVLLYRDPTCGSARVQQMGNHCAAAVVIGIDGGSGTKKGGKKGSAFKVKAFHMPLDYQGDITMQVGQGA